MALLTGAPIIKESLKLQILAELAAGGWAPAGPPVEGTEAGNTAVAPVTIQLALATAISNAIVDQMLLWFSLYAEVIGVDTDTGAIHPGVPPGGPFTTPVIF